MAILEDDKKKKLYTPSEQQDTYVEAKPTTTVPTQTTQFKPSAKVDAAQKYLQSVKDNGYNQQWSKQLDSLVNEYMGRGPFQYDQNEDVQWQQAKKAGLDAASLAMRDTTAQAAALSGGYGNSYAATVGQQVYRQGVADIMAMAPEYYQAAYQRYKDEGDTMLQNIGLAQSMDDATYARYMDALNRAQSEYDTLYDREYGEFIDNRNFDYQLGRDAIADRRYETEWKHSLDREAVEDQRYADEIKYRNDRDLVEDQRYETEWKHSLDREAVEDQRYADELDYRAGRDYIEDSRYQTDQDYKALKEQYDALIAQQDEDEKAIAAREKVLTSPKYAKASTDIKGILTGPYKSEADRSNAVANKIYDMWVGGDFGNGEEAALYIEALADEFGLDPIEILGRE